MGHCEDELRAILAGPVEHQVDGLPATLATADRNLLEQLGVLRPLLERVAVDARGRRPALPRLQPEAALERKPQQIRQRALAVRITRDEKGSAGISHDSGA